MRTFQESYLLTTAGVFRVLVLILVGLGDIGMAFAVPALWAEAGLLGLAKLMLVAIGVNLIAYGLWCFMTLLIRKTRQDMR